MGVEQAPKPICLARINPVLHGSVLVYLLLGFIFFSTLAVHTSIDENIAFFGGVHFGVFLKAKESTT